MPGGPTTDARFRLLCPTPWAASCHCCFLSAMIIVEMTLIQREVAKVGQVFQEECAIMMSIDMKSQLGFLQAESRVVATIELTT